MSLSREERSVRMSALGIALSAVELLPEETRRRSSRPSKEELRCIDLQKKRDFVEYERKASIRDKKRLGESLNKLNERLSVFDTIIGRYSSPSKRRGVEEDFDSVSTPISSPSEASAGADELLRLPEYGEAGYGEYEEVKAVIPPHSPQRFNDLYKAKYVPKLDDGDGAGDISERKRHVYHIRVDFWTELDLKRLQHVYGFSNHSYGKVPIFLELVVPGSATPYDFINTILEAWGWDNSHAYRLSSNTGLGLNRTPFPDAARHYEAEAFTKADKIPSMAAFFLNKFSRMLLEYDLDGNQWQWEGVVSEVELDRKLEHIIVSARGGGSPCQYAHQLMERYIVCSPEEGMIKAENQNTEKDEYDNELASAGLSREGSHRVHDLHGKYYESSKKHVDQILLQRYVDGVSLNESRNTELMVRKFRGKKAAEAAAHRDKAGSSTSRASEKDRHQTIQQTGRLKAAARHVREGLAF